MTPPTIVLGSTSPWRRRVLAGLNIPFVTAAPDLDEPALMAELVAEGLPVEGIVLVMAEAKAEALLARRLGERQLIVTGDQLVAFDGAACCKPADADEARAFLRSYRGREIEVVSAVAVTSAETGNSVSGTFTSAVAFGDLPDAAIEAAIRRGDVLRSCGAVIPEDPDVAPYARITRGGEDAMSGLPLDLLFELLSLHGCRLDA